MSKYIVMSSCAKMPTTCMGRYRRVAVLEIEDDAVPKMISARARGVIRVVETWERLNVGVTERCAYQRALLAAQCMANRLTSSL